MQFDLNRETVVEADLSEYITENLFLQYNNNEILKSCVYFFKQNILTECNYEIYNKKLLTIIYYLQK